MEHPNYRGSYGEGGGGGWVVSGTFYEPKKYRITDHGYKKFVFPNHESEQVRYSI